MVTGHSAQAAYSLPCLLVTGLIHGGDSLRLETRQAGICPFNKLRLRERECGDDWQWTGRWICSASPTESQFSHIQLIFQHKTGMTVGLSLVGGIISFYFGYLHSINLLKLVSQYLYPTLAFSGQNSKHHSPNVLMFFWVASQYVYMHS